MHVLQLEKGRWPDEKSIAAARSGGDWLKKALSHAQEEFIIMMSQRFLNVEGLGNGEKSAWWTKTEARAQFRALNAPTVGSCRNLFNSWDQPTARQAAPRLKYSTPLSSLFLSSCFDFSFPPQTAYDY